MFSTNDAGIDGFPCAVGAKVGVVGGDGGKSVPFDGEVRARDAVGGLGDLFSMRCAGNDDFSAADAAVSAQMGVAGGDGDIGTRGSVEGLGDVFSVTCAGIGDFSAAGAAVSAEMGIAG